MATRKSRKPKGKVTMQQVARRANASLSSVSRVLHDYPGIHPELRERIVRAMQELGYSPPVPSASRMTEAMPVLVTGRVALVAAKSPWEGKGPSGPGWVAASSDDPPRLAARPLSPRQPPLPRGDFLVRTASRHNFGAAMSKPADPNNGSALQLAPLPPGASLSPRGRQRGLQCLLQIGD
ncbi:MAG: LacI family DNA-binding transcriptional regulator [Acidobacteria bacterium]|nr:LacI family DNA-binding transcriptional regulator [Acidobacteriota bacterium]MCI0720342.1 LacI family DNA-binding transcriptional regulator [Acidobacteriota bacterium]